MVTIPSLPEQLNADVSDDDLYLTYDMGGGLTPARKVTRANMLKGVVRTTGTYEVGTLNATGELTAPEGAIDDLTVATSLTIGAVLSRILTNTASLAVPTLAAGASSDVTMTVTGAVAGDIAIVNPQVDLPDGLVLRPYVSGANTVTINFTNASTGSISGSSYSFKAVLLRVAAP